MFLNRNSFLNIFTLEFASYFELPQILKFFFFTVYDIYKFYIVTCQALPDGQRKWEKSEEWLGRAECKRFDLHILEATPSVCFYSRLLLLFDFEVNQRHVKIEWLVEGEAWPSNRDFANISNLI